MKFGAVIPVLNEWRFLPAVVGQLFAGGVERVVLLRGRRTLAGHVAALAPVPILDPRVEVVEGDWDGEHATRNAGIALLDDCDYIMQVDSDELFAEQDLELLRKTCQHGHLAVACRFYTYWKSSKYMISPSEQLPAVVATRADARFVKLRQIAAAPNSIALINRPIMHHLSYVRTDEEVLAKIRTFGHAHEVVAGWYDRVWLRWTTNMENLHPTHPPVYKRAVPAAGDAKKILERWGCE